MTQNGEAACLRKCVSGWLLASESQCLCRLRRLLSCGHLLLLLSFRLRLGLSCGQLLLLGLLFCRVRVKLKAFFTELLPRLSVLPISEELCEVSAEASSTGVASLRTP